MLLVLLPKTFEVDISAMILLQPDAGWAAVISGVFAIAWGLLRTGIVISTLRQVPHPFASGRYSKNKAAGEKKADELGEKLAEEKRRSSQAFAESSTLESILRHIRLYGRCLDGSSDGSVPKKHTLFPC